MGRPGRQWAIRRRLSRRRQTVLGGQRRLLRPASRLHGTADQTIPYTGGMGKRDNGGAGAAGPVRIDGPPVPTLISTWRGIDRCARPSVSTAGLVTTSVANCPDGRSVELITIAGAGHQWPGQPGPDPAIARALQLDRPSTALDATQTIWRFFNAYPKPIGTANSR
jgi:polyhydroxybutyrate depolymerase